MPVIIDPFACDNFPACGAKRICKKGAIIYDRVRLRIAVKHQLCGDCNGLCLRGCDRQALKFAPLGEMFESLRIRYNPQDIC